MITVKPYKREGDVESYRSGFIVDGHAEYAEHGQDIVCASVSTLAQTAILGLNHYTFIDAKIRNGHIAVHVLKDDHTSDTIIKTMLLGLEEIARLHPTHVQVKETGETM